ncbi:OmpA family protein [Vibrio sp. RE86]|uniref:OmpA family protein n=1 Tax=Vibrio sp. RE86 TaxID=2607605 RepID=UPI0014939E3B|nr:OmpA family protein [Vibrio sp. RE86]NOH80072.1 OmpA family protein [Vibrio sp. RE86]
MKYRMTTLALLTLLVAGCAQEPNIQTTRHQIDDLSDDDGDGVINQRDLCANTPANVDVDRVGCTEWQINEKANVVSFFFAMDQDQEVSSHQQPLEKLVQLLTDYPASDVILVGDTSPEASLEYNKALAKRRTHTIREMLVREGINPERISEQEFTQTTAVTEQLHARKRRAIAVVVTNVLSVKPTWNIFSSENNLNSNSDVEEANEQ